MFCVTREVSDTAVMIGIPLCYYRTTCWVPFFKQDMCACLLRRVPYVGLVSSETNEKPLVLRVLLPKQPFPMKRPA